MGRISKDKLARMKIYGVKNPHGKILQWFENVVRYVMNSNGQFSVPSILPLRENELVTKNT